MVLVIESLTISTESSFLLLPVGVTSSAGEAMTSTSVSMATLRALHCGSAELFRLTS